MPEYRSSLRGYNRNNITAAVVAPRKSGEKRQRKGSEIAQMCCNDMAVCRGRVGGKVVGTPRGIASIQPASRRRLSDF